MLTSSPSPSPTIHPDVRSSSAAATASFRCAYDNGSYRHSLPTFYHQQQSPRAASSPIGKWSSASTSTSTSASTTTTTAAATHAAPAAAPRRPSPPTSKRPSPPRARAAGHGMVDAGTQYSPLVAPQRRMERSPLKTTTATAAVGGSSDFTLIDLGRSTGKRRAGSGSGSGSSQRSSNGEPRAPALGPQMPEHRAANERASIAPSGTPAVASNTTTTTTTATAATTGTTTASSSPEKRAERSSSSVRSGSDALSLSKRLRPALPAVKIMPAKYELCETKYLVRLIADMLMELVRFNDDIPLKDGRLTRFHSRAPPGISIHDYLQRLATHATLSPPILLSMVYYIDRLCALYPAFVISSLTVHRFLIASATVASKGLSDSFWTNATYARVGGISLRELALLEMEFLVRVQWRIVPKPEVLVDYYRSLIERSDGYVLEGASPRSPRSPASVVTSTSVSGSTTSSTTRDKAKALARHAGDDQAPAPGGDGSRGGSRASSKSRSTTTTTTTSRSR